MSRKHKIEQDMVAKLTKKLADEGRLIEAGFCGFAKYAIPAHASPAQMDDMRVAFMAGAEHLFSSIICVLDPGEEPTMGDMKRMNMIATELDEWRKILTAMVNPPQGTA